MRRWQRIVLGIVAILALAAIYIFWPQGIWPFVVNLDELEAVNANYNVIIRRDNLGVPHIFGQADADTAFGLGYAHAEDDFQTIESVMIAARGKLGVAFGIDAAPNDYMVQLLRIWDVVDSQYDTIPPDVQAIMQGYADGLNYYADQAAIFVQRELTPVWFTETEILAHLQKEYRPGGENGR